MAPTILANSQKRKRLFTDYLLILKKIKRSLARQNIENQQFLCFWKGLVRDSKNRWLKYHLEGVKYLQYGKQIVPDLNNKKQYSYIKASINQLTVFIQGLMNQNFENYKSWIINLHHKQNYMENKPQLLIKAKTSQGEHSKIVLNDIIPLAIKYQDSYINKGIHILHLPEIDFEGLPKDIWQNEREVFHYYPDLKFLDQYLKVMKEKLQKIANDTCSSEKEILADIALYYQYGVNIHMFENINQSLFANQMNALLQAFGFEPINHGILDFAAMRLQPTNFVKYFIDEVESNKIKKLG